MHKLAELMLVPEAMVGPEQIRATMAMAAAVPEDIAELEVLVERVVLCMREKHMAAPVLAVQVAPVAVEAAAATMKMAALVGAALAVVVLGFSVLGPTELVVLADILTTSPQALAAVDRLVVLARTEHWVTSRREGPVVRMAGVVAVAATPTAEALVGTAAAALSVSSGALVVAIRRTPQTFN